MIIQVVSRGVQYNLLLCRLQRIGQEKVTDNVKEAEALYPREPFILEIHQGFYNTIFRIFK